VPPLPTTPEPFIKKPGEEPKKSGDVMKQSGDASDQLEGSAGIVDAPAAKRKPSGIQ
jgi:hypothetical protein